MNKPQHHFKDFFSGALFGGALGAMTAMFFSTSKGKKIRKELMGKYHEFTEHLDDYNPFPKKKLTAIKKKAAPIKRKIAKAKKKVAAFKKKAAPIQNQMVKAKKKIASFKKKSRVMKKRG